MLKLIKCSWCGENEATEVYTNGEAIYCEECQRYLLKTYGCRGALEEWENRKRRDKN